MNKKQGIYCGSFKPFHKGHMKIIKQASEICDEVCLIVSLCDRENIKGKDMAYIWKNYILDILPSNVVPIFIKSSPIKRAYKILEKAECVSNLNMEFYIFGDENDIEIFNHCSLEKIAPKTLSQNKIKKIIIPRDYTSGTLIRALIINNDFSSFKQHMPEELSEDSIKNIFYQLSNQY